MKFPTQVMSLALWVPETVPLQAALGFFLVFFLHLIVICIYLANYFEFNIRKVTAFAF